MAPVDITRIDPLDLDLDVADEIAELTNVCNLADGAPFATMTGPAMLTFLQLQSDTRPVDGLWLARDDDGRLVGRVLAMLPWRENTDAAQVRGSVHPDVRRQGLGRALAEEAVGFAREQGRERIYTGAWRGGDATKALPAMGFSAEGMAVNAVRRLDLHAAPHGLWDRLYDEALGHARDYDLVRLAGPTPDELMDDMVTLHEAINDAPRDDADTELDVWDAERVRDYDRAMARRRQTTYRVMARHRQTGAWAGLTLLCVDEFSPTLAHQEDTSVVREHRGHRLGLLMKAEMLRWITRDRPEVAAADTWNATTNHHMIAVNERLGASVVAVHETYRLGGGR